VHVKVIESVQRRALFENGVKDLDLGLIALRSARVIYKDDPELIEKMYDIAMYMRHDISGDCSLQENNIVPSCSLVSLNAQPVMLSDFMKPGRILVVVAGSYS